MIKILITGANSYIGTSFEKHVGAHCPDEYAVDTLDTMSEEFMNADFSGYDAVLHVAGIAHKKETKADRELYYKVNCELALAVAEKAKRAGVRQFVFLSTMSVYGKDKGRIYADTLPKPKSYYGKSKLQAELELMKLQSDGFNIAVLRPPMVYGNGCKGNYNELKKLALGLPFFPFVKNARSMIFVDNLCEFIKQTIDGNRAGLFFPQNAQYVNTSEMAKSIAEHNGKRLTLIKGFGWLIKFFGLFVGKFKKAFGSLTYDKSMSGNFDEYDLYDLETSISMTEKVKWNSLS